MIILNRHIVSFTAFVLASISKDAELRKIGASQVREKVMNAPQTLGMFDYCLKQNNLTDLKANNVFLQDTQGSH